MERDPVHSAPEPPGFEASVTELERILRQLEDGGTTLEESLTHYERGVGLLRHCYTLLQSAEQKILLLTGLDAEGKPGLQPFEHTSRPSTAAASTVSLAEEKKRRTRLKEDGTY